ncbi:helix-turn-helix transcriptional regulator [Chitinophaga barathri]|uniref:WYL domain-containing protein n=1 Tax=Chitinophaga barathri TaxID=1647451 RepID=A0A3N4MI50_9BACT|nr:WYL domain-containing protein [Chitinophaga barathri]RPD41457.1 WYL domain-containing protein [Chitinophaga barathri]
MATNKLALLRIKTIDSCLRNRKRKWTLEDLIEKVSDALYEYEGITNGISRRSIQGDIALMRSDKLGYNAPIIITDRKYYTYDDPDYSISNSPINASDMEKMKEIVGVLKQLSGFGYFEEMSDMVARLENTLLKSAPEGRNCIQFEANHQLKGINFIGPLYQAITRKIPLLITYRSFKASESRQAIYFPYLLKEYRNRWFLIARPKKQPLLITLALDRIQEFHEMSAKDYEEYEGTDFEKYYGEILGVTRSEKDRPQQVTLWVNKQNAPYVLTKPLHATQKLLKEDESGILISIHVVLNFELEREILGFGEFMKVVGPRHLKGRIRKRLEDARGLYEQ